MQNKTKNHQKILYIGLGRIGLPQALVFAKKEFQVYGYDKDPLTIDQIKECKPPFYEPKMEDYLRDTLGKWFTPINSLAEMKEDISKIDAIIFTVGTKLPDNPSGLSEHKLELTEHYTILRDLFSTQYPLKKGIIIIMRTTFPLGGTDSIKQYLESTLNLKEGMDFNLAFVPERLVVGAALDEEENVPKIVGTYSKQAFEAVSNIFQKIGGEIISVRDPITAEFCKLTDNSFRNTMFAYSNDIAMHASHYKIDVIEVINAVNSHYSRNHIAKPGFVSGYCLGKDPYIFEIDFLKHRKELHSIWYQARKINDYLIEYVGQKIYSHLKNPNVDIVTILGLSFKEDVDDYRMSDAIFLIKYLNKLNIRNFKLYDPTLEDNKYTLIDDSIKPYVIKKSKILDSELLKDSQAVVVCHHHLKMNDFKTIEALSELFSKTKDACYLFDASNVWRNAEFVKNIRYEGLGYIPNDIKKP